MTGHITEPLLYIDQPQIQKPKAFMQEYYYDTKAKAQIEEDSERERTEDTTAESEHDLTEDSSEAQVNSFKTLSIDQKIHYLLELPEGLQAIRCEFITTERKYRGVLLEANEASVKLRVLGQEHKSIQKADLQDIRMLGF